MERMKSGMREKELKIYFMEMAVISVFAVLILLSVFRYQVGQLEQQYQTVLVNVASDLEQQSGVELGYGSFESSIVIENADTSQHKMEILLVGSVLFILSISLFVGMGAIQKIYRKIGQGEHLLMEAITANQVKVWNADKWENWKVRCNKWKTEGVIGRLYDRIWEVSQIVWQREEERKQEMTYLKDMMNDISHQMKTPLSSLQVFMDIFEKFIIESDSGKNTKLDALVQQGKIQIERMRWLVVGILKLAQIESGCLKYQIKRKPLYDTVEKSIDALQLKLTEKQQKIKWNGDKSIILPHDESWLQEAILNLLKNASEYAPRGGEIEIALEQTTLAVVLSIEDKGPGIAKEHMPKIFNRFYRVPSREKDDGVGIGLALAKSIIEKQGGLISVYSRQGDNSYTRFVITFLTKL